MALCAVALG
ncbi:hypothetical protein SUNI508_03307 [Seiridium unicorne]|uniref:Uncharacterized protein n=1 Tax=Seiridium unicorne TaxID=138068 RepID=A0ABR2VE10_9PEZI